jgi:hypothetical protein
MTDKIDPLQMLDIVDRLKIYAARPGSASDLADDAAAEIEALRKDNDRLDRLMSDIAMEWVRIPHPPRGQMPSALDMAISRAADFTTGLHRIREEKGG